MEIIILQGMTCLGKSTLSKSIEKSIPHCKSFSLDEYKELMWDDFGFNSVKQRKHLDTLARKLFYSDILEDIRKETYEYILVDCVFNGEYWEELIEKLRNYKGVLKTIYLKPVSLKEYEKVLKEKSRDFCVRHAGHGAICYINGVGNYHMNSYKDKIFNNMNTVGGVLQVDVAFNPYQLSKSYEDIIEFIKS